MALTLLRFALRSLLRHGRRSLLTVLAIAGGLAVLVFLKGLADGYVAQRLDAGLSLTRGHLVVRAAADDPSGAIAPPLDGADEIRAALEREAAVLAAAPRLRFEAFARGSGGSVGVVVLGVDPEAESRATRLPATIVEGAFLPAAPEGDLPPVAIGAALARRLDARLGERLALLVEARDGAFAAEAFRVAGIFRTGGAGIDASFACVPRAPAATLVGADATEVVARLRDPLEAPELAARLRSAPPFGGRTLESWREFAPELVEAMEALRVLERLRTAVLFALVGLGIFNTVTLAVVERRREFGVLMALGMRPGAVFALVALEVGLLAAGGLAYGVGAAALVTGAWLGRTGVDFAALGARLPGALEGTGVIYPVLRADGLLVATAWVAGIALAVLVLPTWRILRLDPAQALRERA